MLNRNRSFDEDELPVRQTACEDGLPAEARIVGRVGQEEKEDEANLDPRKSWELCAGSWRRVGFEGEQVDAMK